MTKRTGLSCRLVEKILYAYA